MTSRWGEAGGLEGNEASKAFARCRLTRMSRLLASGGDFLRRC